VLELGEILEKMKGLVNVLDVSLAEAKLNGLVIDEIHFPLNVMEEEA
jgi:hypothetical protein